jgi:hypothetical protein
MFVKLGDPDGENATLRRVASLVPTVARREAETFVLPCDCIPVEIVAAALRLSDGAEFPEITKETALAEGLIMLGNHLRFKEINLILMIAHFLSFYKSCKQANAELEGDTILSFLGEIVESNLVVITAEAASEPESEG